MTRSRAKEKPDIPCETKQDIPSINKQFFYQLELWTSCWGLRMKTGSHVLQSDHMGMFGYDRCP